MVIREDLVVSAAKFLQDPSVASSPPENRVAFLKSKNLTPEEITAALARAGFDNSGNAGPLSYGTSPQPSGPPQQQQQQQPFYGNPYGQPQGYPPYGWQPPPPPETMPRRDWRDWFIMATVVGGVGYGLYSMTKRYVYPLVAPPTPDRLEQDKKAIDEQFERAFALVDQLAKDTDELKAAEKERTERLDQALTNLESVITELKTASKRREEDAERLRDDVRGLKDALPKALDTQREVTDGRLREVNTELKGLKTLIGQRMGGGGASAATGSSSVNGSGPSYLRASSVAPSTTSAPSVVSVESEGAATTPSANPLATTVETVSNNTGNNSSGNFVGGYSAANLGSNNNSSSTSSPAPAAASTASPSSFSTAGKASIPAWQRAMQKPAASSTPAATTNGAASSSSGQPEASGSA